MTWLFFWVKLLFTEEISQYFICLGKCSSTMHSKGLTIDSHLLIRNTNFSLMSQAEHMELVIRKLPDNTLNILNATLIFQILYIYFLKQELMKTSNVLG